MQSQQPQRPQHPQQQQPPEHPEQQQQQKLQQQKLQQRSRSMHHGQLDLKQTAKLCAGYFWCGVKDAFAWPSSLIIIYGSTTIRTRALKSRDNVASSSDNDEMIIPTSTKTFFDSFVILAYQLLWVYPIFLLSFFFNAMWYQQIADRAYTLQYDKSPNPQLTYTRYKWINKGWSLEQRISYFEERWAYFAGFGFLFTLVTFFANQFLSAGIFAVTFPIYIIMANNALPMPRKNESARFSAYIPYRIRIFWLARKLNDRLIKCLPGQRRRHGQQR
ncbi:4899_t:CDS:2 [Ambispora gerdemannii]|uniref:4899_t:CDS:1 n=1 Tax=Ambispora gerdemannii TaxID=144530 RepID=A0A9N9GKD0_9GLOM|nr:4899_t:CDS:2 [Ambispora gerdemannii]